MSVRAYLVDDETLAIQRLRRLLEETGRVTIVGSATAPEEAIHDLSHVEVDVCFLDIEMPRLNGFQVLSALIRQPFVVFTTAYDQYALKAFEVNSVDYLLKPVDRGTLARALDKIETRSFDPQNLQMVLKNLIASMHPARTDYPERVASRLGDRIWFLDLPRVTHFFAEDKLTYANAEGKRWTIDHSIQQLEEQLDPHRFIRIHRGTILNVAWIKEVSSLPGGILNLRLKDDAKTDLIVARDRARAFRRKLGI